MRNKLLVLFSTLSVLLLTSNIAIACSCGCKGNTCGTNQQSVPQDVKEEKVQCPVMKNWVLPSEAADKVTYKDKTYYFCCGGCKEKFLAEPEKYISELSNNT